MKKENLVSLKKLGGGKENILLSDTVKIRSISHLVGSSVHMRAHAHAHTRPNTSLHDPLNYKEQDSRCHHHHLTSSHKEENTTQEQIQMLLPKIR